MTKNNSKNWLEIEEEFWKKFPFAIINWGEDEKATDKMKEILAFFKPYFQEKKCDCCGWDDSSLTHEPFCKLKQ